MNHTSSPSPCTQGEGRGEGPQKYPAQTQSSSLTFPRITLHLFLILLSLAAISPFLWILSSAFHSPEQHLTLENFHRLSQFPLWQWELNSIFLASTHTVLAVTLSALGGFALAKYQFAGKKILSAIMLATLLLPPQVFLPGSYELMYHLNWLDSYLAILVPGSVSVFGIFLFRQSMLAIPDDLLHCARIDGCSELRLWWTIALPLTRPMIRAYTLIAFLSEWNSFLWPQVVLQSESKYTLTMGLNSLLGLPEYQYRYGVIMAATLVAILPIAVLFFTLQREFIAGLTAGSAN